MKMILLLLCYVFYDIQFDNNFRAHIWKQMTSSSLYQLCLKYCLPVHSITFWIQNICSKCHFAPSSHKFASTHEMNFRQHFRQEFRFRWLFHQHFPHSIQKLFLLYYGQQIVYHKVQQYFLLPFFPISSQATDEDKWECSSESESSQDTLFAQMALSSVLRSCFPARRRTLLT